MTARQSISNGTYYLNITAVNGDTATVGTANDTVTDNRVSNHTMWMMDSNGYIYTEYNGTPYYLRNNNGTLTATTSTTGRTVWVKDGSYIYTGSADTGYYLHYNNGWTLAQRTLIGYTISYGGSYLNLTGTGGTSIGTGTSASQYNDNNHTVWTFSDTTDPEHPAGKISAVNRNNSTRYYLYAYSNTAIRISNNQNQNYSTWYNTGNNEIYTTRTNTTRRYIRYSSGWSLNTTAYALTINPVYDSSTALTFATASAPASTVTSETEPAPSQPIRVTYPLEDFDRESAGSIHDFTVTTAVEPSGIPSYIPLTTVGSAEDFENYSAGDSTDIFNVVEGNTGYITGGAYDNGDNRRGDVRISAYPMNDSIQNCYTPANGFTTVYTIDGSAGSYSKRTINLTTGVSSGGTTFKNFLKSKEQLTATLQKTNAADQSVYGIHFMRSLISTDHIITADYAVVDGVGYENCDLPEDAIDFSVHQKGLITFYAGTYHSNNTSLFSLHHVIRYNDDKSKIADIKEIQYIYSSGVEADEYIYMYTDNTFSDGVSHTPSNGSFSYNGKTYSLVFNCEWIWDDPGYITGGQDQLYYFEIPVNKGEYALGSVDGGVGAYLIYLDIAANSQLVDRAAVVENFEEKTMTYEYPVGATFQNTAISSSNTDPVIPSAIASLTPANGSTTVTVTNDSTISMSNGTVNYVKQGVTVNGTLTYDSASLTPTSTTTTRIRRTTYYDYNVAKAQHTVTEVVVKQVDGGPKLMTINAWNTDADWDTEGANATQIATMATGFTPNVGSATNGVAINEGASQTLDWVKDEANDVYCYLINVGSADGAQTLRLDLDAFEGTIKAGDNYLLLYSFSYAIKDNDDATDGATIDYDLDADITFDIDAATVAGLYSFANRSYDITVTTTQTIDTAVVTAVTDSNYTVTLTPSPT